MGVPPEVNDIDLKSRDTMGLFGNARFSMSTSSILEP